jgi:hypothetical protein
VSKSRFFRLQQGCRYTGNVSMTQLLFESNSLLLPNFCIILQGCFCHPNHLPRQDLLVGLMSMNYTGCLDSQKTTVSVFDFSVKVAEMVLDNRRIAKVVLNFDPHLLE